MFFNRSLIFLPVYVIIAAIISIAAFGQEEVQFTDKDGGFLVPEDIVKKIMSLDTMIMDSGGYNSYIKGKGTDKFPVDVLGSTPAEFKKIVEILSAAKEALAIDDLGKALEEDLQKAVQENIMASVSSANELLALLTAANFLDVKSILNAGVKEFAKKYSSEKSNFYDLVPDIKNLIIKYMSPQEFLALIKANPQVDNQKEENLFKMALEIQFGKLAPEGKTAKEYYEANWRILEKSIRVGKCYHLKSSEGHFLTAEGHFLAKGEEGEPARVCIVGSLPDKIGFKIESKSGDKFLSAFSDGTVQLMPFFDSWETFNITGYDSQGFPVIKTAHNTYLYYDSRDWYPYGNDPNGKSLISQGRLKQASSPKKYTDFFFNYFENITK